MNGVRDDCCYGCESYVLKAMARVQVGHCLPYLDSCIKLINRLFDSSSGHILEEGSFLLELLCWRGFHTALIGHFLLINPVLLLPIWAEDLIHQGNLWKTLNFSIAYVSCYSDILWPNTALLIPRHSPQYTCVKLTSSMFKDGENSYIIRFQSSGSISTFRHRVHCNIIHSTVD